MNECSNQAECKQASVHAYTYFYIFLTVPVIGSTVLNSCHLGFAAMIDCNPGM